MWSSLLARGLSQFDALVIQTRNFMFAKHRRNLFSELEADLVEALVLKVPALSFPQITLNWFSNNADPDEAAERALRKLADSGYLLSAAVLCHPPIALEAPAYRWHPHENPPDY